MLTKYNLIPYFGDYTTLWKRIHKINIKIIPENKEVELASDGTGLKTSNGGEYRQFKYGDPNAKRKKYLVVIITADVKKRKLLNLEIHIQGEGQSEPKVAEKQIKEANGNGYKIKKFPENVKVEWQGNKNKEERSNFCHGISNAQIYTHSICENKHCHLIWMAKLTDVLRRLTGIGLFTAIPKKQRP